MELPLEKFQNEVLRPIIKQQNNFIISYFEKYEEFQKIKYKNEADAKIKIENCLKSDTNLKNILIGSVISKFSFEQLNFFYNAKAEISRRIVSIVSKRIFDNKIF